MRHKITVRNVFVGIAARPEGSPHHGSAGRLAPPSGRNKRGLSYSIWWITATAMYAQMSRA